MNNELAQTYQTYNPATNDMASVGRKGDTMMAHVTPGDYVIPKDILVQHPDFLVKLKKVMADEHEDYRTHMVGSGFENINPETGAPEFGWGKVFKDVRSVVNPVARATQAVFTGGLSEVGGGNSLGARAFGGGNTKEFGGNLMSGNAFDRQKTRPSGVDSTQPFSPEEMKLPGSLQELGGLTDQQRRTYLASQGAYGEGLGGSSKDYYANLLQRNIQSGQGNLLPAETQYLGSQGINTNLSGQDLIDALRGL